MRQVLRLFFLVAMPLGGFACQPLSSAVTPVLAADNGFSAETDCAARCWYATRCRSFEFRAKNDSDGNVFADRPRDH